MKRAALGVLLLAGCTSPAPEGSRPPSRERAGLLGVETLVDAPVFGGAAMNQADLAIGTSVDHWLLAWSDDRLANNGQEEVWAARLGFDGGLLDPSGLSIAPSGSVPAVACLPDPCLVAWTTFSEARGVRISADGGVLDPAPIVFSGGNNEKRTISLATSDGGFLVSWAELIAGTWTIQGRLLSSNGLGAAASFPISSGVGHRTEPAVIPSVNGEYWIAWTDRRSGNADIYAAQVSPAGVVTPVGGQPVSAGVAQESRPAGAVDPASGELMLAWDDGTDIFGRRFDSSGAAVEAGPFVIDNLADVHLRPSVLWDLTSWGVLFEGQGGARSVVLAARVAPGTPVVVSPAVELSNNGRHPVAATGGAKVLAAWIEDGPPSGGVAGLLLDRGDGGSPAAVPQIARSANSQFGPDVAGTDGGFVVVWEDSRLGYQRPACRAFDRAGNALGLETLLTNVPGVRPRVASGAGQQLGVWIVNETTPTVRALRLSGDCLPVGAAASPAGGFSHWEPAVAFGGGAFLVVWTEDRLASEDLYSAVVTASGSLLATPAPFAANVGFSERSAAIAGNAQGWLVAWSEDNRIAFSRVTPAGLRLDDPASTLSGSAAAQFHPSVASDGTGYLLAWFDDYQLSATRILGDGGIVDTPRILLDNNLAAGEQPHTVWNGRQYVVTWRRLNGEIVAQTLPASGSVALDPPMVLLPASPAHREPRLAYSGDSALVVASSQHRSPPLGASRVVTRSIGAQAGGTPCGVALECRTGFCVANVCVLADGGFGEVDAGVDGGIDGGAGGGAGGGGGGGSAGGAGGGAAGDGGLAEKSLAVGCGCDATSGTAWFALPGLISLVRRRRSAR